MFNILVAYRRSKNEWRQKQIELTYRLECFRVRRALSKLSRVTIGKQLITDQLFAAEQYHAQYLFQQVFGAWAFFAKSMRKYHSHRAAAKQITDKCRKKRFLKMWTRASWRPLSKFAACRRLALSTQKLQLRQSFSNWIAFMKFDQSLDIRVDAFQQLKEARDKDFFFRTFAQQALTLIHQRRQNDSIEALYNAKVAERVLCALRRNIDLRTAKREKVSVAYAKQASTIIERTFVIFKYIAHQRRDLRKASEDYLDLKIQAHAPTVLS